MSLFSTRNEKLFIKARSKDALVLKDETVTYTQLLKRINHLALQIKGYGAEKVIIFLENRTEWVYALYAVWRENGIVVPVDFMATADDLVYIIGDSGAELILCSNETSERIDEALSQVKGEKKVLNLDKVEFDKNVEDKTAFPGMEEERTALIMYTSGTTGNPKGVMLSFQNLNANIKAVSEDVPIFAEKERILALLPFHHILPLLGTVVAPLKVGATIYFAPSMNPTDILGTLKIHKISMIIGVPKLYEKIVGGIKRKIYGSFLLKGIFRLLRRLRSLPVSRIVFGKVHSELGGALKFMVCGGAALDKEIAMDFRALGFEIYNGYGMTETAPMISFPRPGRIKDGSVGEPLLPGSVKIEDGEILVRGQNVMQGYYEKPEETADVLNDGWLKTGDLGYLDGEGYLFITGRRKEVIVLPSGKNIDPSEVEFKLMNTSPLVSEVGVYMEDGILKAIIVPDLESVREQGIVNLEESFRWDVVDRYNRESSPHKRIKRFALVRQELPRTRLGKLRRFMLPGFADEVKTQKKSTEVPTFEEYEILAEFLENQTERKVTPDDHIEIDLGLDSLDKVSMQAFLSSTFGVETGENDLLQNPTVVKLAEMVREKKTKVVREEIDWSTILREQPDSDLPTPTFILTFFKHVSRVFLKLIFRLKVEGIDNIPEGPFIIAPNHQSSIDGLFAMIFLKDSVLSDTYSFAKKKHFKSWWRLFLARRTNILIIDINRDLKGVIRQMGGVLKSGKNVIIFPEGTRSRDGKLGKFKKTFAILSRELDVPVVPVAISGAFRALPKGSLFMRPFSKIRVRFLPPLLPDDRDYDQITETVKERIKNNITL